MFLLESLARTNVANANTIVSAAMESLDDIRMITNKNNPD
jgi:hypothetical protein